MENGDRELVNVCLLGLRLGKGDGKKIRRRGKVNRESMSEWQAIARQSDRGERDKRFFFLSFNSVI